MREREERGEKGKEGKGRKGKWEGKEGSPPTFITKFTPMVRAHVMVQGPLHSKGVSYRLLNV